jgi:hypothetical protein
MGCRGELSACVDAIHAVKPGETHCPRGTTGSKFRYFEGPAIQKNLRRIYLSYRTLLATGFQFPPLRQAVADVRASPEKP